MKKSAQAFCEADDLPAGDTVCGIVVTFYMLKASGDQIGWRCAKSNATACPDYVFTLPFKHSRDQIAMRLNYKRMRLNQKSDAQANKSNSAI